MKNDNDQLYQKAFDLNNAEKFSDAIEKFKSIIENYVDPEGKASFMIAMLYFHELNDHIKALPYAFEAVRLRPSSETASLCLVHCLFKDGKQEELQNEIRRYLKTGGKIDHYQTLFEENIVTKEDFT